jgi:ABC-2 type transport system ATP-binding protein
MALTADDLVVIGRGQLISQGTVQEFVDAAAGTWVHVRSPQIGQLSSVITSLPGATARQNPDGSLDVYGVDSAAVGELAARSSVVLHELSNHQASLEEAFLEATRDVQDYRATSGPPPPGVPPGIAPPQAAGTWAPPTTAPGGAS